MTNVDLLAGILASFLAGLATALGSAGVFFLRTLAERWEDALLSAAAGIMLAASFFSLILPGIALAEGLEYSRVGAVSYVIVGIGLGALLLWSLHRRVPHEHFVMGRQGAPHAKLARIWLFVFAITLHNVPEGMAVGVGFAGGGLANGMPLAVGIGIQNVPEGLAVAVALRSVGYDRGYAFGVSALTGLVEGAGGALGALASWLFQPLMPGILGLAAGAMLYIIGDEIIPETHRRGHQSFATFSLLLGLVVMMFLDATLG